MQMNLKSIILAFLLRHFLGVRSEQDGSWCHLPPDATGETGISCLAIQNMYTFNNQSGSCEPYVYGGCGATMNLFQSEEECVQAAKESGCMATERIADDATNGSMPLLALMPNHSRLLRSPSPENES